LNTELGSTRLQLQAAQEKVTGRFKRRTISTADKTFGSRTRITEGES